MKNQPTKCAITGKNFEDGDLYLEEPIEGSGDQVRFVSPEGLRMSHEDIEKAKKDGRIKTFRPESARDTRDTRGDGATGPRG